MQELVLIAGGGTMGAGIGFVVAAGGYSVELVEPSADARGRASDRIARRAEKIGDTSIPRQITMLETIPSRSEAAIVIEAVPEVWELKASTFRRLSASVSADTLLATNTSSFSVAALSDLVERPQRVVGLHFFNPPEAMSLVEIVHGQHTRDEALERAFEFAGRIGKTAILTADTPGFVVNRVARPFYLQALHALEHGVAPIEELDALARAAGFRMGPFELMDFIGLDVNLATTQSIYARTGELRLSPVKLQEEMVEKGLLGRKSAAGFYDYRGGSPPRIDAAPQTAALPTVDGERVAVIGFGPVATALCDLLAPRYGDVLPVENDDLLGELPDGVTIAVDVGDGVSDRSDAIVALDRHLGPETIMLADAYATDLSACAHRLKHPQRLAGYGMLGLPDAQTAVEIVEVTNGSDDAVAVAHELFEQIGKDVVLVADRAGLFLGRCVGSIVNEAVTLVHDEVANADDVDTAMRLGTNYPQGPIAWGRQIGGRRIARILQRLAQTEGSAFVPHRALWVLDVEDEEPLAENPGGDIQTLPAAGL